MAEKIDARQSTQGFVMSIDVQIRLIHDFRTTLTLADETY
jgi:hypothetical protein